MDNWFDIIIALLAGGLLSFVTYLLGRKQTNEKTEAETKKVEAETRSTDATTFDKMQETIGELSTRLEKLHDLRDEDRKRIDALENEIRELKRERIETDNEVDRLRRIVRYYRSGVKQLIEQLRELNIKPNWEPDDNEIKE